MVDTNTNHVVSAQEQQMLESLQRRQTEIMGRAAEKIGLNPEDPKHKAAFEAHIKELGAIKNEEDLAKLHEKLGMDFKGFQQQFGIALKGHETQKQQGTAEMQKIEQDFAALSAQAEEVQKKKGTRNIITIITGLAGAVGSFFLARNFVNKTSWGDPWKTTTNIASGIVGGGIIGKITSLLIKRPLERKTEELQAQATQMQSRANELETRISATENKLLSEQDLFEVEFHARAMKAKLAEIENAKPVEQKQDPQKENHHKADRPHHASDHAQKPHAQNTGSADVPHTPDMEAEIRKEREEGKNFAHKDEHTILNQPLAAGAADAQHLAGSDVVIEKDKKPWEATANIAPKAGSFASREAVPSESHLQGAIESKELAATQQLAV